jgi:quercetin dioxygenase-like cupin family protein
MAIKKLIDTPETWPREPFVQLEAPFRDERGEIIPLVDAAMQSAVMITSRKGTVRANHYHKTDWHYCYVLEGCIEYYYRPTGNSEAPQRIVVRKGQMFFTPPMVDHAMVFAEDTVFLTLGRNPRDQESYESDVVRIDPIQPRE